MAKDPAFLYYDGDAAKDVSHMNRLERGAYFDLIQAQRKFRGYTVEQARKILGRDFEEVWPALELILSIDNEQKYYIEWLRDSMEKRAQQSEIQRKRIQDYWDKKKKEPQIPAKYHGITADIPIDNENEIVLVLGILESKNLLEDDESNKNTICMIVVEMMKLWMGYRPSYVADKDVDYPALLSLAYYVAERNGWTKESVVALHERDIIRQWDAIAKYVSENGDKFVLSLSIDGLAKPKNIQRIMVAMAANAQQKQNMNSFI